MNARPMANIRPNVISINLADLRIKRWEFRLRAASIAVIDAPLCIESSRCLPSKYFGLSCSNIRDRYLIDLVSVLVHDDDDHPVQFQPAIAAPCLRSRASATASVRAAALPGRSMLFAVGEMEIVTRHGRTSLCGYNSENIENRLWSC
jgi:hypothetical protein